MASSRAAGNLTVLGTGSVIPDQVKTPSGSVTGDHYAIPVESSATFHVRYHAYDAKEVGG